MRYMVEIPRELLNEPADPMRFDMDDDKFAELVGSIRKEGVLQNLVVFPVGGFPVCHSQDEFAMGVRAWIADGHRFEISAGHRRYKASGVVGIKTLHCLVLPDSGKANLAAMCAENAFREKVNPADEAFKFHKLIKETDCTEAELVAITGHTPDYIYSRLDLIAGHRDVFEAVQHHGLKLAQAKQLNRCENDSHRLRFIQMTLEHGASAETIRGWVNDLAKMKLPPPPTGPTASDLPGAYVAPTDIYVCICCGGKTDPYNMVPVWIHKWELDAWKQFLHAAKAAKQGVQIPLDTAP